MKTLISVLLVTGLVTLSGCGQKLAKDTEVQALSAANDWLQHVDKAQYDASWDTAASTFKSSVPKSKWSTMVRSVRNPLGYVVQREVKKAAYHTSLPGAPDGEYLVIQFRTEFANKGGAIETVTPMLDSDGNWRVSGYYIR